MLSLSVYNNLLVDHYSPIQTRYDAHKRSELNDIYVRIRRINATQPLYKFSFNEGEQDYVLSVKEKAGELRSAIKALTVHDGYGVFTDEPDSGDFTEAYNKKVIQAMEEFAEAYNGLFKYIKGNSTNRKASKKLYLELNGFVSRNLKAFEKNGVSLAPGLDGTIVLNPDAILDAARCGTVQEFFSEDSEVMNNLLAKLDMVSQNPVNYLDKMLIVYSNTQDKGLYSPYLSSIYAGLIYNDYY